MNEIQECMRKGQYKEASSKAHFLDAPTFAKLLASIDHGSFFDISEDMPIRVKLLGSWCSSKDLTACWSKMLSKNSSIVLVDDNPDYYVVVNSTTEKVDKERTVVLQMEPTLAKEWCDGEFLDVWSHDRALNNLEWHLSPTLDSLLTMKIGKDSSLPLSTVQSTKYFDPGHIKRIDFIRYAEEHIPIHIYGPLPATKGEQKGELPYHQKDKALFPYKYTFAAENHSTKNYITEKLVDAILAETLCFYWGCPNVEEYIDSDAYVPLDLDNKEESLKTIREAMTNNWWEARIEAIRRAKKKILLEQSLFKRLERILN